ncbi:Ig-like domain-containing protein [Vibrio algivorus]|uniref:Big-1 domain-containing protein n=1 Tax=Vibrio algivorus TaxID=1667024 RepID=A0A557PC22_9VIBR|nr:Ig-like domain-containing protein [Vibrio algivorus]TVO38209.1 hypothetical protein FOF44_05080 [Vibrio algivorus]
MHTTRQNNPDAIILGVNPILESHISANVFADVTTSDGLSVLPDQTVTFTVNQGAIITDSEAISDENGRAVTEVFSPSPGTVTVTAQINDSVETADIDFVGNDTDANIISLEALTENIPADGAKQHQVKALVLDVSAQPLEGQGVVFNATNNAIAEPIVVTDVNGEAICNVTSETAGLSTITASVNATSEHVDITFIVQNLDVMGARRHGISHENHSGLVALNRDTGIPEEATWTYDEGSESVNAVWFNDPHPEKKLVVKNNNGMQLLAPACVTFNNGAGAAISDDHHVYAWGDSSNGGDATAYLNVDNAITVVGNGAAFAALCADGSVIAWGDPLYGGDTPDTLTDVQSLSATLKGFCALHQGGNVTAWGDEASGATVPEAILELTNITRVVAADNAYCALCDDGSVVAWGSPDSGGVIPDYILELKDIKEVFANANCFCVLREDNSVLYWGGTDNSATLPGDIEVLRDVANVYSSLYSFCVLREGGSVMAWGEDNATEATVPDEIAGLIDVVQVSSTNKSFCIQRIDNSVMSWGEAASPTSIESYRDIVTVCGDTGTFVALRKDGTVISWGVTALPETISALTDVVAVYRNYSVFGALTKYGSLENWGQGGGGDHTLLPTELTGSIPYYL